MSRISRCIMVFNIAAHSQQYNHVKEENFNSCGPSLALTTKGDDESQLRDNDVMVVLALIKTICLMGFPCYAPCPASFTSQTGCSDREWLDVQVTHVQTLLEASNVSVKTSYIKNKLSSQSCKTPLQRRTTINYHLAVWFYCLVVTDNK